ncbi:MAG: hypothetical protein GX902_06370 [Lentisphaerae bacterium]|nr:hypothetical protein [Lentisphaerota bacterium]
MKKHFASSKTSFLFAGLLLFLPVRYALAQAADNNAAPAAPSAAIRNPFAYSAAEHEQGLVPVDTDRMPTGIRLAAVLLKSNGDALAALRLPGETAPIFVRVDDLISVNLQASAPAKTTSAKTTSAKTSTAISMTERTTVYLLVKSITATGVEVAPRVRPSEVHLIR